MLYKIYYCPLAASIIYAFHVLPGSFAAAINIDAQIYLAH